MRENTKAPSAWQRLRAPFCEFGFAAGSLYVLDQILRRVSGSMGLYVYEMMVQPITREPLLSPNLTKNLTFVQIHEGNPDIERMPARREIKRARFEQGAQCLGVYRKSVLIGYLWYCSGQYEEDEVRCTYVLAEPSHAVFDFDLFIFPEHRMGIAFMAIWHGANQHLHTRGIRHTFSRLTRFNLPSRRAHAHLGWKCIGRATFLKTWNVETMIATIPPFVGITWSSGQRTRLRLSSREVAIPKGSDTTGVAARAHPDNQS